jgi:hypothetical protein
MQNRGHTKGYSLEERLEMSLKDPESLGIGRLQLGS